MSDLIAIQRRLEAAAPRFIKSYWPPDHHGIGRPPKEPHLSRLEPLTQDDVAFFASAADDMRQLFATILASQRETSRLATERDRLHAALRDVLSHLPESRSHRRVVIDSDPAGSTYDMVPYEWFTNAVAALGGVPPTAQEPFAEKPEAEG